MNTQIPELTQSLKNGLKLIRQKKIPSGYIMPKGISLHVNQQFLFIELPDK